MDSEGLSFRGCQAVTNISGANAVVSAVAAAPAANKRWGVVGWMISASGNVAAATTATVSDGTTTITMELAAGAIPSSVGFVNLPRVLPFAIGASVTLTVNALGAGIIAAVTLFVVPLSS